jgi:hypothetical protein
MKTDISVMDILKTIDINSRDFGLYNTVETINKFSGLNVYDRKDKLSICRSINFTIFDLDNIKCNFRDINQDIHSIKLTKDEIEYFLMKFSEYLQC